MDVISGSRDRNFQGTAYFRYNVAIQGNGWKPNAGTKNESRKSIETVYKHILPYDVIRCN